MNEYKLIREAINDKSDAAIRGYKPHEYNLEIAKEDATLRAEITDLRKVPNLNGMTVHEYNEKIGNARRDRARELNDLWDKWVMTNIWHFMRNDLYSNGIQYPLAS